MFEQIRVLVALTRVWHYYTHDACSYSRRSYE